MSNFCRQVNLGATYSIAGSTPSARVVSPDGNGVDLDDEAVVGGSAVYRKNLVGDDLQ